MGFLKVNNTGFLRYVFVVMALITFAVPCVVRAGDGAAGDVGKKDSFTIVAVGDIFLGERAVSFLKEKGAAYPYSVVGEVLKEADLAIGNLESPLTSASESFMEKKFILKARPEAVASLKASGIDVFSLANNHIMDFGGAGLDETLALLDKEGLLYAGAGSDLGSARRPATFELSVGDDKVRVAVLSYSNTFPKEFYAGKERPGTAPGYQKYIKEDIREARSRADIVIVAFHWGAERMRLPKDYQRNLAHIAIDSGAQMVIGHHPHVIQPVEVYKSGVIFYSLGNFVFGFYSPKEVGGMMASVVFSKQGEGYGIERARVVPLEVDNWIVQFVPRPMEGAKAMAAYGRIAQDSASLGTFVEIGGGLDGNIVFNREARQCIIEDAGKPHGSR